jgi:hypothetical protein
MMVERQHGNESYSCLPADRGGGMNPLVLYTSSLIVSLSYVIRSRGFSLVKKFNSIEEVIRVFSA